MTARAWLLSGLVVGAIAGGAAFAMRGALRDPARLQELASPGPLSRGHAFLAGQCGACHVPIEGPTAERCIACHANDRALLQEQRTAFHATIGGCRDCHGEHGGEARAPIHMDHVALAKLGLRQTEALGHPEPPGWLRRELAARRGRRDAARAVAPHATEAAGLLRLLDCAACHAMEDRHQTLFGRDCSTCHGTEQWAIAGYRHPSPRTTECSQCHQAPPSHFMMHFGMVSQRVAAQPHARVDQCFLCHVTAAWTEIRGIGYYKHH